MILNPSVLPVAGYSYDGSSVRIGTALIPFVNGVASIAYDDGMEGVEYTRSLGDPNPTAMTFGVYTPGDITMKVHAAYSAALMGVFAPLGNIYTIVSQIQVSYRVKFSQAAPPGSQIALPTRTDLLTGFRVVKIANSNETGGAGLMEDWTCKALQVRRSGNSPI
jgi:hypothetical protein